MAWSPPDWRGPARTCQRGTAKFDGACISKESWFYTMPGTPWLRRQRPYRDDGPISPVRLRQRPEEVSAQCQRPAAASSCTHSQDSHPQTVAPPRPSKPHRPLLVIVVWFGLAELEYLRFLGAFGEDGLQMPAALGEARHCCWGRRDNTPRRCTRKELLVRHRPPVYWFRPPPTHPFYLQEHVRRRN